MSLRLFLIDSFPHNIAQRSSDLVPLWHHLTLPLFFNEVNWMNAFDQQKGSFDNIYD